MSYKFPKWVSFTNLLTFVTITSIDIQVVVSNVFFNRIWGRWTHWGAYSSKGLKPLTSLEIREGSASLWPFLGWWKSDLLVGDKRSLNQLVLVFFLIVPTRRFDPFPIRFRHETMIIIKVYRWYEKFGYETIVTGSSPLFGLHRSLGI